MDATLYMAHFMRRASFGATNAELYRNVSPNDLLRFWIANPPQVEIINLGAIADGSERGRQTQLFYNWLLNQMVVAGNPLHERMVNFWRDHFTVSLKSAFNQPQYLTEYEGRLRANALGDFRDLLLSVTTSPAMLRYLNNDQNRVGNINENFSREVMELFTLGLDSYTEKDVQEGARALTGWVTRTNNDTGVYSSEFVPNRFDAKPKTYLGKTGNFKTEDVVDILANHPATAKLLATKLWTTFVYPNPEPAIVQRIADVYQKYNRSIGAVVNAIFSSPEFYSDRAYRSQIKNPIYFTVGALRQLEIKANYEKVVQNLRAMGQVPYNAPTVKGWADDQGWLTAPSLLTRLNAARQMTQDYGTGAANGYTYDPNKFSVDQLFALLLDNQVDANARNTTKGLTLRDSAALILSAPNYQLL